MNSRKNLATNRLRRTSLAIGLGLCLVGTGVIAQSTTGNIFGQAPVAAGETVLVTSSTGLTREVPVDSSGRYRINTLPVGTYDVSLKKDGAVVDSRKNIVLTVGAGTTVSFEDATANVTGLSSVTVSANALPTIDVSSVDSRTVITARQLAVLPLRQSAEAIALLAPGVVAGSRDFGNVVSFGGSSVSENAYYINGFNTSDPLKNIGGTGLPYGAIDQQENYTGGYSAMYGRSDGGVISQVGKRGTNEWHFGGQIAWAPRATASDRTNTYYPDAPLAPGHEYTDESLPGTIYRTGKNNKSWETTYSAYVGGPLIENKLFLFVAAEADKSEGTSTSTSAASVVSNNNYKYSEPKVYAKLDWNINDSNLLELTDISSKESYSGALYDYDYATGKQGGEVGSPTWHKYSHDFLIGKYTSYITDDLTFSVTYGKNKTVDYQHTPGLSDTLPYLSGVTNQDPAITGGTPITNGVPTYAVTAPGASSKTHGIRADLQYKIGDHELSVGIDNMNYAAYDEGQSMGGPGYAWLYGHAANPAAPLNSGLGVGPAGGNGYYVRQYVFSTTTSMSLKQKAQYLEDRWQVSDRWLLSLGIRNDQFENLNNLGQTFVKQKNQWAPRIGFSFDVLGDSTFKVYGNLGRYYLAMPSAVAIRGGSASTLTYDYQTYTGIDADGNPTGLAELGPGPVSPDGETGDTPDPKQVSPTNLKSEYQDEAILGFSKMLGPSWVTGAKVTVRRLESAIDDVCDEGKLFDKMESMGIDLDTVQTSASGDLVPSCKLFNPGKTNTYKVGNVNGGYYNVNMSQADWGFAQGAKRKYYALDLFLEHPFDGKWQARVDYTFSRSYGNTEGQVKSDIGQADVSKTQDWDSAQLMEGAYGIQSNDRTHQLKAYGSYAFTPEWMVSGSLRIATGTPKSCEGFYGNPESDPLGYGSSYHYCNGVISPTGSNGRLPYTRQVDLGIAYRPDFANHKLGFKLDVFNVFNEQKPILNDFTYEDTPNGVSNTYNSPIYYENPRFARFSVTYDY
ncbi:MAG TPA: TonB-dependent receptor [Pseudomonas sp.]|uniref:TonB-dependent receptor n=1 Tax=Pseudomonas sp. TaxID=306 RepID=UPI002EDB42F4